MPVVGLRMPSPGCICPTAYGSSAPTHRAPIEAMRSEGMGRAAWEPHSWRSPSRTRSRQRRGRDATSLRELISVMRLFKAGGIGLGPTPSPRPARATGAGSRPAPPRPAPAATGSARTRPSELVELAATLEARPDPDSALDLGGRPLRDGLRARERAGGPQRPPAGPARGARGHGPVGASLPMRAAALIADGRWTGSRPASRSRTPWSWSARR